MTLLVRTAGNPAAMVPALRAAVRELDPDQPLGLVAPLDALLDDQMAGRRFNTWLLTAFGIAALMLTAIGLYGLLAYLVALRRREIAVRLSVGATPQHVLMLVIRNVAVVVCIGVSLGFAGALMTAALLRGLLFGITPWNPLSQAMTIALITIVALTASWIPVRRAMGIDPATVLRSE
jgi:ABC-type antimicrobial peptide transport system permease subunit